MLNAIWVLMIVGAIVCGALTDRLDQVAKASTDSATAAVTLAIGLVGVMVLWLGLMRVLHEAGLLHALARLLRPLMTRLFPEVPASHPAMSMMILNMTSNMLGLANASTPFGIKAMMELDKLNQHRGTATNAMALFLAINTSNLALLPTGMIATRAGLGSQEAGAIVVPTIIATAISTLVAIIAAKLLAPLPVFKPAAAISDASAGSAATTTASHGVEQPDTTDAEKIVQATAGGASRAQRVLGMLLAVLVVGAFSYALCRNALGLHGAEAVGWLEALKVAVSKWVLVVLLGAIVLYGVLRGVKIYEAVVEGGKEGFDVALRIIPFLVAILVGVGMLRASGAIDLFVALLEPITALVGMPAEALPMALLRPLSGSGAFGVASEIMKVNGPDSLVGYIVSTMQGSTETTFYVLAVYFGAVQVRNARHTVAACLIADTAGVLAAVWACRLVLT